MRRPLFLAALLTPLAHAEPVYLDCTVTLPKVVEKFQVKADEASGKITHTNADGSAFNADGFFSPTEMSYKHVYYDSVGKLTKTYQYTISRVDLTLVSYYRLQIPGVGDVDSTNPGRCQVIQAPPRQF